MECIPCQLRTKWNDNISTGMALKTVGMGARAVGRDRLLLQWSKRTSFCPNLCSFSWCLIEMLVRVDGLREDLQGGRYHPSLLERLFCIYPHRLESVQGDNADDSRYRRSRNPYVKNINPCVADCLTATFENNFRCCQNRLRLNILRLENSSTEKGEFLVGM